MGKEKRTSCEATECPVGRFFSECERLFGTGSKTGGHLNRSRLELLKAVRSWVDGRIEDLESAGSPRRKRKVTKIKVE
jgi:hypothetical protein